MFKGVVELIYSPLFLNPETHMQLTKLEHFTVRPYRMNNTQEQKDFPDFLKAEEPVILRKLLGYDLYTEFAEAIDASSGEAKWANLRDGASYSYCGKNYRYTGIVAMIVPYLYAKWLKYTFDFHGSSGVSISTPGTNSKIINPSPRIAAAWSEFSALCGNCNNQKGTLYGFLNANTATYPDWEFEDPGRVNRFNL
jgi:hypothetical protein